MNLGNELKELVENVNALVDTLAAIRSHVDNSIAHIPGASGRLDKITGETESATHHLIDIVDSLGTQDGEIVSLLDRLKERAGNDADLVELESGLRTMTEKSKDEHFKILEMLQFQDLTSQQINYVGLLLNKIESELLNISKAFDKGHALTTSAVKGLASDPNATFVAGGANQGDVDSLIDQFRNQ